ncbi:MAG: efflux RND transporter permease subunit, partial [Bryobacteraceae bacterium]
VFIPILLMGGIVGRLFREFAVTLSIAIGVSLIVSLTTTPMMCARLLKRPSEQGHGRLYQASERAFQWVLDAYAAALRVVLRHPAVTLLVLIATICVNFYLFYIIPKGFFPEQDTGRMQGMIKAEQNISFQSMRNKVMTFVKAVNDDPAVTNVVAFTGGSGGMNQGRMFVQLKDLNEHRLGMQDVMARIRHNTMNVPGASLTMQPVQDIRTSARLAAAEYQYTLQSQDLAQLSDWSTRLLARMRKLPEIVDLNTDQQNNGLEAWLAIDRDTASRLGLTVQSIDSALYDAFGQRQVSTMYTELNQYHVVMEVAPQYWQSPSTLQTIFVQNASGNQVPLSAFTRYSQGNTPLSVNHQGQFPSVTLSFNLRPGVALSEAVDAINTAKEEMGMPAAVHGSFAGTAQTYQSLLANEGILIFTALFAVYIVLGVLYESYIHPITIISTLPSAGVGALLALLLFKIDLSVIAIIGIILLIGIVKKNAILMIDFALDAERKEGKSPVEAIYEACLLRFRPIIMTTMAALLGAVPLAFGMGTGAELRQPLGIAIVGGLIMSQLLTLFTTPIVYLYMDSFRLWFARLRGRSGRLQPLGPELAEN